MNLTLKLFVLLLLVNVSISLPAQDKQIDNALLWKVTGNSLSKPSFLFGTIHLQDKRLFNFNDSLYSFIQAAEGFALEIHPDSMISAIMQRVDEAANDKLLSKYLEKDEFDKVSRKLKKDLGIDARKLTVKEAYMLKDHLSKPDPKPDDMPTFVDAYLFGVARNQGKEIVGLEEVKDQVNMLDDIRGDDLDFKQLLKTMKKEKSLTEKLIQLYIREDLRAIHQLMSYLPEETEDKLLNLRNLVMVSRMDSLIQSKSFVVAVGTAHLPGEKGMIELLRKKGYTVEPVYATTRTHANSYSVKAQQKTIWYDVTEPKLGYSTRMPGKPTPMDMLNGNMKMNMFMDLTTMKVYYTAFVVPFLNVTKANADSVLQGMCKNAMQSSKGETISSKRFAKDGFEGIDFVYRQANDRNYARLQCLAIGKRVYMLGFISPRQEDLQGKEAAEFFDAFTIEKMAAQDWQVQSFPEHFFELSLPATPKVTRLPITDSTVNSVQYGSTDNTKGSYYGITVVTVNAGFAIPDDSVYFATTIERLQESMVMKQVVINDTTFRGFYAKSLKATLKEGLWLSCLIINRGNRVYNLLAVGNADDSASSTVQAFFESFSFMDYPQVKWKQEHLPDYGFTIPMLSDVQKVNFLDELEDSAAATRDYQVTTYDPVSATSFYVTRRSLSRYLWAKHDSIVLKSYLKSLVAKGETVSDYKFVRNGNTGGIEFNITKPNTTLVQRIRVLLSGPSIYVLQTDVPGVYWKQYDYDHFFTAFRLDKEEKTDFLRNNSFAKLVADLRSTDSATYQLAHDAVRDVLYDSTDLEVLLKAACQEYVLDTTQYYSASDELFDEAGALERKDFVDVVVKHYHSLTPAQEQYKYKLIELLAEKHTDESYTALEKLLKNNRPTKGYAHGIVTALTDSLELTKKLYPFLLTLSSDTLLGTALFDVHARMLDSSLVQLDEFRRHLRFILAAANHELKKIAEEKEEFYYSYGVFDLIDILSRMDMESTTAMLKEFMNSRKMNVKFRASVELLKKHKSLDPSVLMAIATDKLYRVDLYSELKKLDLQSMFPSRYLNQKAFAESYLYNSFEDENPDQLELIGERTAMFKGKKQKFFLYKATFGQGAEKYTYLCIAGPFGADAKSIVLSDEDNITGLYYQEEFKQSLINKHFKAYLEEYENEGVVAPPVGLEED